MPSFKKSLIVEQFQGNYLKMPQFQNPSVRDSLSNKSEHCPVTEIRLGINGTGWFRITIFTLSELDDLSQVTGNMQRRSFRMSSGIFGYVCVVFEKPCTPRIKISCL